MRAIVLARLANLVEGHAGARPRVAAAVAAMLDGGPLPAVPARGNGGSGEILALGHLFGELAERVELEPQGEDGADQRIALRRGARGRRGAGRARPARARRAHVRAVGRGDPSAAGGVRARARASCGATSTRPAPCARWRRCWTAARASARPPGAGELPRAAARARPAARGPGARRATAAGSLASVTDNPVFLPPGAGRPLGALDLQRRLSQRSRASGPGRAGARVGRRRAARPAPRRQALPAPRQRAVAGGRVADQAAAHGGRGLRRRRRGRLAQTTVLGLGGFGQNDLPSPAFLAWGKATAVGTCLDRMLAVLAALASQALHVGRPEPRRRRWRRSWTRSGPRSPRSRRRAPWVRTPSASPRHSPTACFTPGSRPSGR